MAPALRSGPSRRTTSSASITACTACMPVRASGQHGRGVEPGQQREHVVEPLVPRVQHQVALGAGREHRLEDEPQVVDERRLLAREPAARDEHGLRVEQVRDLAQPVLAQRLAARDEVDDRIGDAEARGELDRAGQLDELGLDAELGELELDRAPVRRRDAPPGETLRVADVGVARHRNREAAAAEPERQQLVELDARLDDHVAPRDAELDGAIGRPARDVVGTREEQLEIEIEAVHVQRAAVGREPDPGVVQQLLGLLREPALRGKREADEAAARHDSPRVRSSTSRYPPSPRRSHCATRVTVVVDPPTRSATW